MGSKVISLWSQTDRPADTHFESCCTPKGKKLFLMLFYVWGQWETSNPAKFLPFHYIRRSKFEFNLQMCSFFIITPGCLPCRQILQFKIGNSKNTFAPFAIFKCNYLHDLTKNKPFQKFQSRKISAPMFEQNPDLGIHRQDHQQMLDEPGNIFVN